MKRKKLYSIIFAVAAVNIAGILLRYFNLDTYIILAGFRFHLSFVLPFLVIFWIAEPGFIKNLFTDPHHKRTVLPLLWILLPAIVIVAGF